MAPANWHLLVMGFVTVLAVVAAVLRLLAYDAASAPVWVALLTVAVGLLVSYGATYGGSLTFDDGFNVENATSSAEWQESEQDVHPAD